MAKKPVKYSVVDAFTERAFKGNPAAVCFLEEEKDAEWMQHVAAEFNISETCFLTRLAHSLFALRWFTPVTEVELCGHATLAASHALFSSGLVDSDIIEFQTLSGVLTAKRIPDLQIGEANKDGFYIELNFPADPVEDFTSVDTSQICAALNVKASSIVDIKRTLNADDILVVLESGTCVTEIEPQIDEVVKCPGGRGIIVTVDAPSESGFDFYSRFFCPKSGINEDPVCGSAHCSLTTYWSKKLGKLDLNAYQASPRGGVVKIHLDEQNQRVLLRGKAVTVMEGCILV